MTLRDLSEKDVIQLKTGENLGRIDDLAFEDGQITQVVLHGRARMFGLLGRDDTVCVGAVCGSAACGAAIAQREQGGGLCYLRYIFVDPKARLCGLGTYLLRGLLGQLRSRGAQEVQAIFSPSMLESGGQTLGILERAGFSRPGWRNI